MSYIGNNLQVAYPSYRVIDDISSGFNGVLKTFALRVAGSTPIPFPINPQQCLLSVNNIVQKPDSTGASGFTLTGSNIVFATAPTAGWSFFGTVLAGADYVNVGANFPSGTAAVPSVTFDGSTGTGLFLASSNVLGIATSGVQQLTVDSSGNVSVTGVISSALGTAAAPAYRFTGDPNTGIYSPGADQVAISTGGSGRLFVDANGNIGVGTSSPANFAGFVTLALADSSGAEIDFIKGSTVQSSLYNAGDIFYIESKSTVPTVFVTNSSERLRITSAGLVGVGVSAPQDVIHAKGNSTYAGIIIDNSSATGGSAFCAYRNGVQKAVFSTDSWFTGTVNDNAAIYSADGIKFYTNNVSTAKAVFTSGGLLGIGTTGPSTELHISRATAGRVITRLADPDGRTTELRSPDNVGNTAGVGTTTNHPFVFFQNNTEAARIDESKRLLVGTSSGRAVGFSSLQAPVQVETTTAAAYTAVNNTNDANGCYVSIAKTRGTSAGAVTAVQNNDELGAIRISGSDGTGFVVGAQIIAAVDGTPGTNDLPTRLVFSTTADGAASPTERMRIKENGNVLINTTTEGAGIGFSTKLAIDGNDVAVFKNSSGVSANLLYAWNAGTSGDNAFFGFGTEGTYTARGSVNYNRAGGVVAYNTTSDYRAKTLIGELKNPGETIDALKIYCGVMNGATVERPMLVAHEAQEVAPYCVTGEKDAVDDKGNPIYQQMDHQVLVPLLIAEIQQLRARVAALESA